jgi:putative transcriptional regulator
LAGPIGGRIAVEVPVNRLHRPILALLTILVGALPAHAQTPERVSLAGQLLIASPTIADPRFARTVILMVQHDRSGALGIVVNLPMGERPVASLLEMLGEPDAKAVGSVRIFAGGPVQPQMGFVVHSADYQRPETIAVDGRVAMTASRDILRDIANDRGPKKSLIAFGYSGWGPGQLEGELGRGSWFTVPAEPKLIFDEAREKVWDLAFSQRTQDL